MSRISTIKKVLNEKNLKGYQIAEITDNSYEQYYVKGKLETVRRISDTIDNVVIYLENEKDGKKTLGQADFKVTHILSKKELSSLVDDAISKAKYIHNEPFELVSHEKGKSYTYTPLVENPMDILEKISKIFYSKETDKLKFNALECFFNETSVILTNSNNINLKKKTYSISVEAIPSYYSDDFKTELYRMFNYDTLNYDNIEKDACQSLSDLEKRGNAVKAPNIGKTSIILRSRHINEMFWGVISTLSYPSVYNHSNLQKIGDSLQKDPYEKFSLYLTSSSKADFFDGDGVILSKHNIIKDGIVNSYFGSQRFAQYLGVKPTGNLPKMILSTGKKSGETLKKKPYIEIIDLSGIQVDPFAGYLGGEVRLAEYFDGEKFYPISGFSFSTNIYDAINHTYFSKEKETINNYEGPAVIKIDNVDIL